MTRLGKKQRRHTLFREVPSGHMRTDLAEGNECAAASHGTRTAAAAVRQVSPIRVLLMCDHPIECEGIRSTISKQPAMELVGCISTSPEQLEAAGATADIILLDIDSESRDVVRSLPRIVALAGEGHVLALMAGGKPEVCRQVAQFGAMGVVFKDQGVETLAKAIRKVHSGEVWFDRAMMANLIRQNAQPPRQPCDEEAAQRISALTRREREVIQLLGQGLNAETLAGRLFISETTVRHHLSSILEKLEVRDRFDLVFYAYRHGLAVPPTCPSNNHPMN